INPNSKAYNEGIHVGDYVHKINGQKTEGLQHQDAQRLIKAATDQLILELSRSGSAVNGGINGDIHDHIEHELDDMNAAKDSMKGPQSITVAMDPTKFFPSVTSAMDPTKGPQNIISAMDPTKGPQSETSAEDPTKGPQNIISAMDPTKGPQSITAAKDPTKGP
ncbi:hypothetical protein CHS0354_028073, partial [Potamilus streckersoni]